MRRGNTFPPLGQGSSQEELPAFGNISSRPNSSCISSSLSVPRCRCMGDGNAGGSRQRTATGTLQLQHQVPARLQYNNEGSLFGLPEVELQKAERALAEKRKKEKTERESVGKIMRGKRARSPATSAAPSGPQTKGISLVPPGITLLFAACRHDQHAASGNTGHIQHLLSSLSYAVDDYRVTVKNSMDEVKGKVKGLPHPHIGQADPVLTCTQPLKGTESMRHLMRAHWRGRTKSLFICIDEKGKLGENVSSRSIGPMQDFIQYKLGFSLSPADHEILTDTGMPGTKPATRANIVRALSNLAETTRPGDRAFLFYAGHFSRDAAMCPQDRMTKGDICQREYQTLLKVKDGVHMICMFNTCHSGFALGLPYALGEPAPVVWWWEYLLSGILGVAVPIGVAASIGGVLAHF